MTIKIPTDRQFIALKIEKLVYGGAGLAKHEGRACFIDGVLPGETVRARITEQRSQYSRARLCETLEPSAARIKPSCPLADLCGGCQWQHIAYAHQLSCKAAIVDDCLKRIGKLHHLETLPPVPSPLQSRYRSRAAFKIASSPVPVIGFFQKQTHAVIEVNDCLLLEAELIEALKLCRDLLKKDARIMAAYTDLQLLAVASQSLVLGLWHDRANSKKMKFAVQTAAGAVEHLNRLLRETVEGLEFLRDADNFYQVNRLQNLAMIQKVTEFLAPVSGGNILDLFCGCGNFSLFLAKNGGRVTGIDSNKEGILEARNNARLNGIENARFDTGNVHALTAGNLSARYDGVLINPPRSGCMARTLQLIADCKPSIIVYVSCNPSTLARDLRLLADTGYDISKVQPFDMFPQTYHIETVVQLVKHPTVTL